MTAAAGLPIGHLEFALRLLAALALGSIVGLERQWRNRMAGLRTNALVATGTALFVMLTPLIGGGANPTQIPAYIISGIGFLAGGVIFKERLSVSGLNTAATLWCTAAIGVLVGDGFVIEAAIGTAAILVANVVLRPVVRRINLRSSAADEIVSSYEIIAACAADVEERVRATTIAAIRGTKMTLTAVYTEDVENTTRVAVTADVTVVGRPDAELERIVKRVGIEPGVVAVSWRIVPTTEDERELVPET